jgi:glucose/mannose-6-phosphate isomerase
MNRVRWKIVKPEETMLDDLKLIHERDAQDALGIAEQQWQQLEVQFDLPDLAGNYSNVVFVGMGGSALAALIATTWPGVRVPFETSRTYTIPSYVGAGTLFIASSYSGNTEETLAALTAAEATEARIVVIAAGGKLADIAKEKGYPLALLPQLAQPRFAALASLKALVTILERAGVCATDNAISTLQQTSPFLREAVTSWLPTIPTAQNQAKQLALEVVGKSAVIYAGTLLYPAAYKWKISFNENAKNVAWCNSYPEFNHNEFMGWASHPTEKPYAVIDLRSDLEHERIQKRFEVSERLLSGRRPAPEIVNAEGNSILEQLVWTIALGDFVSLYTALLNGINPTPVELIESLKKALND